MAFLSQLYRYRQREQRSPPKDLLTEALAEWLRQATLAGEFKSILQNLFKFRVVQDLRENALSQIHWQNQYVIGPGHRPATNKRPDLIGRGPDVFLIIENKTWAPFEALIYYVAPAWQECALNDDSFRPKAATLSGLCCCQNYAGFLRRFQLRIRQG